MQNLLKINDLPKKRAELLGEAVLQLVKKYSEENQLVTDECETAEDPQNTFIEVNNTNTHIVKLWALDVWLHHHSLTMINQTQNYKIIADLLYWLTGSFLIFLTQLTTTMGRYNLQKKINFARSKNHILLPITQSLKLKTYLFLLHVTLYNHPTSALSITEFVRGWDKATVVNEIECSNQLSSVPGSWKICGIY